jgi:hypothetical protein
MYSGKTGDGMKSHRHGRRPKGRTPKRLAGLVERDWELAFTRPWVEPRHRVVVLLLYLAAAGAAAFLLAHAAPGGTVPPDRRAPVAVANGLFLALATWAAAAMAVNKTTVRLADGRLTVSHHPVFWPGGKRFRTADIDEVTVREDRSSVEDGPDLVAYRLLVRVRGSFPRTLVTGLDDPWEAEYLWQRLVAGLAAVEGSG